MSTYPSIDPSVSNSFLLCFSPALQSTYLASLTHCQLLTMPFSLSSWTSTLFLRGAGSPTTAPYEPLPVNRNIIEKDEIPFRQKIFCKQITVAGLTLFIGIVAGLLIARRGTWNTMVCTPSLPLVYCMSHSSLKTS